MCPPESGCAALGHADVTEFALLDEARKRLDRVLNRYVLVDTRRLEQVQLLRATECRVNAVHATGKVLRRCIWCQTFQATLQCVHAI